MRNRDNTAAPRLPAYGPSGLTKREDSAMRNMADDDGVRRSLKPPRRRCPLTCRDLAALIWRQRHAWRSRMAPIGPVQQTNWIRRKTMPKGEYAGAVPGRC